MFNKEEPVEKFKRLCESSTFAHREEIIKGLENGNYVLRDHENRNVSSRQLLDIYRHRAERLLKYESSRAEQLRNEILAFCSELKKVPDDTVNYWTIAKDKAAGFAVFYNSEKILGCLLTVDRRMVSEADWKKL
ncbi:MAG TPA: hypothetical protein VF604_06410 [Pyrinomonadaceae bacterium]|jgi:hypothetical protein